MSYITNVKRKSLSCQKKVLEPDMLKPGSFVRAACKRGKKWTGGYFNFAK
jgi:hypothetical protein